MKKTIATILSTIALGSIAVAGPYGGGKQISYDKSPAPLPEPQATGCDCFEPGGALSIFAAGFFPDADYDDEIGGGIAYEQFFTQNVGIAASAAWYATDSAIHNYSLDAILRLPLGDTCIAPYALAGIGVHTNGETEVIGRYGAGLDVRIPGAGCKGIFADWIYTSEAGDISDYSTARVGIKLPF